uniref:Uncharacterized protein n=1 Tax=uncultured marine virus TaxID=186617 RepID=A0A0F7LAF3_9VIRU|nr:hypothetical protein [uncultured marine virus]
MSGRVSRFGHVSSLMRAVACGILPWSSHGTSRTDAVKGSSGPPYSGSSSGPDRTTTGASPSGSRQ